MSNSEKDLLQTNLTRDLINIVLVEPQESRNVGSVARAMMNFGFSKLHLVAPRKYSPGSARVTACWANSILGNLQIHSSLSEALGGMHEVIGFSGRVGKNRSAHCLLPQWAPTLRENIGNTALLFGPEDTGLTQEHVSHCRVLVKIPVSNEYPSFNLSHAVLLVLSEISRGDFMDSEVSSLDAPTANDFYQLQRIVESIAKRVEFYGKGTPQPVPFVLRSLLRRLSPDMREMGILLGLFGKVERYLERTSDNDGQLLSSPNK